MIIQLLEIAAIATAVGLTPKLVDIKLTGEGAELVTKVRGFIAHRGPGAVQRLTQLKDAAVAKVQALQAQTDVPAIAPAPTSTAPVPGKSNRSAGSTAKLAIE